MTAGARPLSRRGWVGAVLGSAVGMVGGGLGARASELASDEFQVAFISKMLPYVTWPRDSFASAGAPVVVGLAGRDPFSGLLEKVVGPTRVENRRVEIRVVPDAAGVAGCHALFIPSDQMGRWTEWRTVVEGRPVLTIAADESGRFLDEGGVFNLRVQDRKLEINRSNGEGAGLRISSKLLRIAVVK